MAQYFVRELNWPLYKVKTTHSAFIIEAPTVADLYWYVAKKGLEGNIITSVVEIKPNGSTPKIPVLSTKEYKAIHKALYEKNKRTPVPGYKGICYWCHKDYLLYDWAGLPEKCPTCGRELKIEKE